MNHHQRLGGDCDEVVVCIESLQPHVEGSRVSRLPQEKEIRRIQIDRALSYLLRLKLTIRTPAEELIRKYTRHDIATLCDLHRKRCIPDNHIPCETGEVFEIPVVAVDSPRADSANTPGSSIRIVIIGATSLRGI